MATRNVEIMECDRRGCRRRKGVAAVEVEINGLTGEGLPQPVIYKGDLCPYHQSQLINKTHDMFNNTKKVW